MYGKLLKLGVALITSAINSPWSSATKRGEDLVTWLIPIIGLS